MLSEPEDFVICRVCGKKLSILNSLHLNSKDCKMKQEEVGLIMINKIMYTKIFGDIPTYSKRYAKHIGGRRSPKTRKKMSISRMGKEPWNKGKKGVQVGWNKGLTKETDPRMMRVSVSVSNTLLRKYDSGEIVSWNKGLTKENDERVRRIGELEAGENNPMYGKHHSERTKERLREAQIIFLGSLSDEEQVERLRNSFFKCSQKPNVSEAQLIPILEPLGFEYTGADYSDTGQRPDFSHIVHPLLLEYDGEGGHDPKVPWVPDNIAELDDQRDEVYRGAGYRVLRLLPEDLGKGREFVQQKVKDWMVLLGYSTEWALFDVGEWFK